MTTILVTGATGTIGSRLVTALAADQNLRVLAATRQPATLRPSGNAEAVELDWTRPATIRDAVRGVDKLFLLVPIGDEHVAQSKQMIEAARGAGVRHIVNLSTAVAELQPGIGLGKLHAAVETLIRDSGVPYTLLRPGLFMTDFVLYWRPAPDGAIYLPFGQGASAYIDPQDIADIAALVLASDDHLGKTYELTGAELLRVDQVAARIAEAAGRAIKYVDVPEAAARGAMTEAGMPASTVAGMLEMFAALKAGRLASTSTVIRDLTGRAPRPFAQFARDQASAW